jgi:hypothetical protein
MGDGSGIKYYINDAEEQKWEDVEEIVADGWIQVSPQVYEAKRGHILTKPGRTDTD